MFVNCLSCMRTGKDILAVSVALDNGLGWGCDMWAIGLGGVVGCSGFWQLAVASGELVVAGGGGTCWL